MTLAGRDLKIPSPEDLILMLSIHAAKHVWGRLIWLCDIAEIVGLEKLDWDWIRGQARELGIERILGVTLLLGNRLLGMERAVCEDRTAQGFAEQIAISMAAGVEYEEEKMSYFRLMMRLRERRTDGMRFLWRLAFTPGPGEWKAVRLPQILFPFYRVVRLGRLMGKGVRR
jgi:hypothetical protein